MKEKITKAEFINTWASEWDENTGWKVNENFHKQFSEQLEQLISAEVEKRIAERMPSDEEIDSAAYHYGQFPDFDGVMIHDGEAQVTFAEGAEWLRSRLTSSGKPNNSEGGKV